MVAGSGPDLGTDKTKRLYDGKLDSWPAAKIKIKSYLFKLGLWDVVQDGPSDRAETPVHAHAGPLPGEPEGEYFYSLRDTDINGPCSGKTILEVVKVLSSAGTMAPDSIYIYNSSITNNDWEPWSPGLIGKIAEDTALVAGARRVRISVSPTPSTPYVSSDCPWPPPPAAPLAPSTSDRQVPPPRRETVS